MGAPLYREGSSVGVSVFVLPDGESLALAAGTAVVAQARRAARDSGRFTLALSGGTTPQPAYEILATPPHSEMMPWEATHVFWSDERFVDRSDARSNEGMARRALLDHVPIPETQVYSMGPRAWAAGPLHAERQVPACDLGTLASSAAEDYELLLRSLFGDAGGAQGSGEGADQGAAPRAGPGAGRSCGLDLVLLGLGADGHTASLFPGSKVLDEQERWVTATADGPAAGRAAQSPLRAVGDAGTAAAAGSLWRVTLTAAFINRAATVLFLVSGAAKAAAVKEALEGDADPRELPARLIRPAGGRVCWLLDEEAASGLGGAK